jgi:prevent-host-death family protein
MKHWQLQEAKAKLSYVVKQAMNDGPQEISLHGKSVVIVISKKQYDQLVKPKMSLLDFMQQSPWRGIKLPIKRDRSLTRDVDL